MQLAAAIRLGDLAMVSELLAASPELAVARVHGGRTALHVVIDWPGYSRTGKGLTGPVVHGLDVAGESLGMIVLDRPEAALAADVAGWITGMPPRARPFGFSGRGSEHEEVWQYLFALGMLPVLTLPGTLLFAECTSRRIWTTSGVSSTPPSSSAISRGWDT
jgi:hypothetical protein